MVGINLGVEQLFVVAVYADYVIIMVNNKEDYEQVDAKGRKDWANSKWEKYEVHANHKIKLCGITFRCR